MCDSLPGLLPELGPGETDYVTKPFRVAEVLATDDPKRVAAAVESLPFKRDGSVYGVYELPVTW